MLRISPDEVSFNDIDASGIIYAQTSKFEKAQYFYRAFEDQAQNLFTIRDRQEHAQDKRLISHAFSRANIVLHQESIYTKAAYLMDRIAQRVKDGQTIPLFPAFRCLTLDTISEFAFGKTTGALQSEKFESEIFEAIDKATDSVPFVSFPDQLTRLSLPYLTGSSFNIFRFSEKRSGGQVTTSLPRFPMDFSSWARRPRRPSKKCEQPRPRTTLTILPGLSTPDTRYIVRDTTETWTMFKNMLSSAAKSSTVLDKEHLISEAIVMLVAGTDTTASALALSLNHLLQQPEVYRKLQDEVRTVMPTVDSRPAVEELYALPFLDACIKEGLRISCPSRVRLPRTVPEGGWTFKGQYFPAGVRIRVSLLRYLLPHGTWLLTCGAQKIVSLSPLYFLQDETVFPSPQRYDPSRWMVDEDRRRQMLSYFHPFSRGTRQCIGQNLSLIEQKIVLSMFVRRFSPKDVLKKTPRIREAITIILDDPVDVGLEFATDVAVSKE